MSDLSQSSFLSWANSGFPLRQSGLGGAQAGRLIVRLHRALQIYLTRRALPALSPRQLADIGVSPSMAVREAARLPWDLASTPRQPVAPGIIQRLLEYRRRRHLVARHDMLQRNLSLITWC
jgi:uncharacterized protein YjiS (DUF1127 family)